MDQDIKNLQQEVLRIEQRLIELVNRLSGYDTTFTDVNFRIDAYGRDLNSAIARVVALEEARKKQIQLNRTFQTVAAMPIIKPEIKVDNLWNKIFK